MTASDVWPDGRPKTRSGFNQAAWDGEQPLAKPLERRPLEIGDSVALTEPVDADGNPVVRGIVLWVDADDDGEQHVTIAREVRIDSHRRYAPLRWDYRLERHKAALVDPAWHIQSTMFDRSRAWLVAGQIAVAVGAHHAFGTGTRWTREHKLLLGAALELAHLGHRDELDRQAAS